MKKYFKLIKFNLIVIALALILFYWGIMNNGFIRMGFAILILFLFVKTGLDRIKYELELDKWFENNQNRLIFYYPTKKHIQEEIKTSFIPQIPYDIIEVYYDGPKLISDIKYSILIQLLNKNPEIRASPPHIIKIKGKSLVLENLSELKNIKSKVIDFQILLNRIKKLKNS